MNLEVCQDYGFTKKNNYSYEVDFGRIVHNSKAVVDVKFKGENLSGLSLSSTCGCTVADKQKINENEWVATLEYKNTHLKKSFGKTVTFSLKEGAQVINGSIVLKGIVESTPKQI